MTRRRLAELLGAVLALACEPRHAPSAAPSSSGGNLAALASSVLPAVSAAAAGSAAGPLTPAVTDEVEELGLNVRSGTIAGPTLWGFSDLHIDRTKVRLEIELAPRGAPLERLLPADALAVVNGGYFEANYRPSTWVQDFGHALSPKSDTTKGGVLALSKATAIAPFIGPFSELEFDPELAVQSFPLIVEPEGKPGIHGDDGRRAARTVACVTGGELHLIVVAAPRGEGPTLFECVAIFRDPPPKGFGCSAALNLDGGPSAGVVFASKVNARSRAPLANVGYGIAVVPLERHGR